VKWHALFPNSLFALSNSFDIRALVRSSTVY